MRNAIICPEWQFTKPVSFGNISQIQNYGVVLHEVNLKHGQCLWSTQENTEGFWQGWQSMFTSQFSYSFSQALLHYQKSISWLIIVMKQRKSGTLS